MFEEFFKVMDGDFGKIRGARVKLELGIEFRAMAGLGFGMVGVRTLGKGANTGGLPRL